MSDLDEAPFLAIWHAAHAITGLLSHDDRVAPVESAAVLWIENAGLFRERHILLEDCVIAKRDVRRLMAFDPLAVRDTLIQVRLHALCNLIVMDLLRDA